jgi:hypothetical protein
MRERVATRPAPVADTFHPSVPGQREDARLSTCSARRNLLAGQFLDSAEHLNIPQRA